MNQVTLKLKPGDYQTEEAYRTLRTNLQFCGEEKKVIALTSCTPNEGKSTVSRQLAVSLAKSGKKTILIDSDLRKSVLMGATRPSGQKGLRGLSHYLSGQNDLQEVVYITDTPNLSILYAGPFPPNPAELLSGRRFKGMLQALRKVYDYVIVDTPPIGSVIDGAVVAGNCDGAILVIESGAISYRFAQSVQEQLERSGCPVLGVVLNKVDLHKSGYGRYYGKYYGKYGQDDGNGGDGR